MLSRHATPMDSIFFERQEGQLCAQHCLNSLLQAPIFTAVDLAGYARELDEYERATMAEGGFSNPEFIRFMEQPSSNMDDTGYFSVQVIEKALSMWNLRIESLTSPQMNAALEDPTSQQAFICNHDSHWLTVRKLGQQWFNLNSLLRRPELISDTYLSLFLHQLQLEGYSIFVVLGMLPPCEANQVLSLVRVEPPHTHHPPPLSPSPPHTSTLTHHHLPPHVDQPHSTKTSRSRGRAAAVLPEGGTRLKQYYSSVVKGPAGSDVEKERKEEQDLQMAMALSASLEQSQEQFEINQQLSFQEMEGAERGEDPAIYGGNEASRKHYVEEDEEDEAAITAAIYASLEDGQRGGTRSAAGTQAEVPTLTSRVEGAGEEEEEEESSEREREQDKEESIKGDEGAHSVELPTSQEELRIRRLKHLDQ